MDSSNQLSFLGPVSAPSEETTSQANEAIMLRTQIKANARLLFSASKAVGATEQVCEVGVMTAHAGQEQEKHTSTQRGYTAVLTIPTGIGRNWSMAAKGETRESLLAALQSLFEVTATALEKFQGHVFKSPTTPSEIAGGMIDESLVKSTKDSSWTSMFGS